MIHGIGLACTGRIESKVNVQILRYDYMPFGSLFPPCSSAMYAAILP